MITILHNPRCSKSRQALELLKEKTSDVQVVEYLKNPLTADELKNVVAQLGISAQELIRKNEQIYKDNFKGKELTEAQWIEAMVEYPKLMERPVIIKDQKAVIGRPPENVEQLF